MADSKKSTRTFYNCRECPAFCCSVYPRVRVEKEDIERLAEHFEISFEEAEKRFTKQCGDERVLRRKKDALLGETCKFLDPETRGCTIYEARPEICRTYPDRPRCVYYDLWKFEEGLQERESRVIPLVQITFPDEG